MAASAVAAAPVEASAQTYAVELQPHTFEAIPLSIGGPETTYSSSQFQGTGYTPTTLPITLPFNVEFYGQSYNLVTVVGNGTLSFGPATMGTGSGASDIDKRTIPSTTGVRHNFVAVWQDQLVCNNSPGGPLKSQVVTVGTKQAFVIQWTGCRRYASNSELFTAQVWLYENDSTIEVHYGPLSGTPAWSAGMGIENADGTDGTPGLGLSGTVCNPTCTAAQFPTDHRLVYTSGPSVTLDAVTVTPQPVNIGYPLTASALVTNQRSKAIQNATVRFWMGPSALIAQAQQIGTVTGVDIAGNSSISFPLSVDTSGLTPGTYYVIAEFDPAHAIFPVSDPGPVLASTPFTVKDPTAQLRVVAGSVNAPGWVESGGTFDVSWTMDNRDLLEAKGTEFQVVLSTDTNIDGTDRVIGTGYFALPFNGQISVTKTVTIPDDVADGAYYVGVWLDPSQAIPHVDRSGTKRMSVTPTTVGLELEIKTSELPGGRVGEAYSANLSATGGDNNYTWTVVAGTLPTGLSISKVGGVNKLSGTPSRSGVSTFTLQAASDRFTDTAIYTVEILPALVPLEMVTSGSLPNATLGSAYSVALTAHGGNPPYTWSIDSGTVPAGLSLSSDGRFGGTPMEQGSFPIFVKVTDATTSVTSLFTLDVGADPLVCTSVTGHAPVMAGVAIRPIPLMATGGVAPYRWSSSTGAVPGLDVSEAGEITGTPTTAGTYDWTVEVADSLTSAVRCHVALEVSEQPKETELVISTGSLPRGQVASSYLATLETTGFTGTVTWSMGEGTLPEGLLLTTAGTIQGVPSVSALDGGKTKTIRFEVVAVDSAQKEARATFDLELFDDRPATPPVKSTTKTVKGEGCQSTSGDAGLLALGLALGVATLVRRRS